MSSNTSGILYLGIKIKKEKNLQLPLLEAHDTEFFHAGRQIFQIFYATGVPETK